MASVPSSVYGGEGGGLTNQDIVRHEALPVIDAPPDVAVDVPRRSGIDVHGCSVREAGHNLCTQAGLLADVPATTARQLDLIVVTEDWVEPALLTTNDGRIEVPAS